MSSNLNILKLTVIVNSEPFRKVYWIDLTQSILSEDTLKTCQTFTKKWIESGEEFALMIDCRTVKLATPSMVQQQISFVKDVDTMSSNNVLKMAFLTGMVSKPFVKKVLVSSKPQTPHGVFDDEDKAWSFLEG